MHVSRLLTPPGEGVRDDVADAALEGQSLSRHRSRQHRRGRFELDGLLRQRIRTVPEPD